MDERLMTDRDRIFMAAALGFCSGSGVPNEGAPPLPQDAELMRRYRDYCEHWSEQNISRRWAEHWRREAERASSLMFAEDMPEGTEVRVREIDAGRYMTDEDITRHSVGPDLTGSIGISQGFARDGEGWGYVTVRLTDGHLVGETYDFAGDEVEPVLDEDPPPDQEQPPRYIESAGVWVNEIGEAL
jgi:hypothetical protein